MVSKVLDLVDSIYDAGMAFDRWPATLERIADAFGASDAALGTIGPAGLPWLCAPRTDPEYLRSYPENFHACNDVWHRITHRGVGVAFTDEMVIERREFRRSAYYNEWAKPQGYHNVIGGLIDAEKHWRTVLMLPGRRPYTKNALRLFNTLAPHIRRAVQLNRRLDHANSDREALLTSIDHLSAAAILLDASARVLAMNRAAETLIESNLGLRIIQRRLEATQPQSTATLHRMIAGCGMESVMDEDGTLEVFTASTLLRLSVIPLRCRVSGLLAGTAAALLMDARDNTSSDTSARLRDRFGLTEAEARFAAEIVKGDGKRAAAERCGISYSTARSHLSRIFEKTGVHRQAALVRLVESLPSDRAAPERPN